jgi:hypothetical protein
MSQLHLHYDTTGDRLSARLEGLGGGTEKRVPQNKVTLRINKDRKVVAAFDIDDFSHFVSYQLLGDLFGEDLIRAVTEFQYEVRAQGRRDKTLELATKQRPSGRRLLEQLLRAA